MLNKLRKKGFQIVAKYHAEAILTQDMPDALQDIEAALGKFTISSEELVRGGGGEGDMTQRLRRDLTLRGWRKHNFTIEKVVDKVPTACISHEIDHVKVFSGGTFALEIEWNNKDPFFDRDLENFKRLHAEGAISVAGVITRGTSLQSSMKTIVAAFAIANGIESINDLVNYYEPTRRQKTLIEKSVERFGTFAEGWAHAFVSDKFGEATTHWRKLEDRIARGVGNPCPLLLIGIPEQVVIR